jgi:hypothetical protein
MLQDQDLPRVEHIRRQRPHPAAVSVDPSPLPSRPYKGVPIPKGAVGTQRIVRKRDAGPSACHGPTALTCLPRTLLPCRRSKQAKPRHRGGSRARRLTQCEEVRRRFGAGETLLAISRAMALWRDLVRLYAYAQSFPERAVRVPGPSVLDPYSDYLGQYAHSCKNGHMTGSAEYPPIR